MPHITAAMPRSVRRGVSDILFDGLLGRRSITGEVSSVKNTFSSWDNCMAKSYCKWPVIIAIIVVSVILFSILWCIIRCACCGMSCCCTCFSFLKCCDCCGGCCDGQKDRPMKHLDDPYPRQGFPAQGYQAPAPMMGGALGGKAEPPQYAQFEVGRNGLAVEPKANALHEDALPPMPSWDNAAKKHVLEEEKNAVELGELDPATGQKVPLMTGAVGPGISGPPSPMNETAVIPYGARPGHGVGGNGYIGVAADPYAQPQAAFNQNGYRSSPSPGPGRGGPGRRYGTSSPQEMSGGRGYGPPSPQDSYGDNNSFAGAPVGGYSRGPPQRQNSNDAYNNRPFPTQPQRQYSSDSARPVNPGRQYSDRPFLSDNFQPPRGPRGPGRIASPPLQNNAGFDFGGGQQQYSSRPSPPPQQMPYGSQQARSSPPPQQGGYYESSTAAPSYTSRSAPQEEPSYPGYRPYQPPSNQGGRGAPQVLQPGRGREPQNWDPVQR